MENKNHLVEETEAFNISNIRIVYRGGTEISSPFDKGDLEVQKFEKALGEFISGQPITVCTTNGSAKICQFNFKQKTGNFYRASWHNFSDFKNLLYVEITHRDVKGNITCKTDRNHIIYLKQGDNNSKNHSIDIHTAWFNRVQNVNYGFSAFKDAWNDFKAGKPMKKKWKFKAECSKHETTLYLFDLSLIEHLHFTALQTQP